MERIFQISKKLVLGSSFSLIGEVKKLLFVVFLGLSFAFCKMRRLDLINRRNLLSQVLSLMFLPYFDQ